MKLMRWVRDRKRNVAPVLLGSEATPESFSHHDQMFTLGVYSEDGKHIYRVQMTLKELRRAAAWVEKVVKEEGGPK
jgi:hypothetical protein